MREDQRFEIERAFDLLPHVIGSSWAIVWFRLNGIKRPTREEYRNKVTEYFEMLTPIFESYPDIENFTNIKKFVRERKEQELRRIKNGENKEVEKRYDRYVDYG